MSKTKFLTEPDVKYLKETLGEKQEDIDQIERFYPHVEITIDGKKSTIKKARDLLTQEQFLASLDRAVFHTSTSAETEDGKSVSFDTSKYWSKLTALTR